MLLEPQLCGEHVNIDIIDAMDVNETAAKVNRRESRTESEYHQL